MKKFGSSAALLYGILLIPAASFAGSWTEVPRAAPSSNSIYGLVSLTSSDAWAVGGTGSNNTQTLIEHWDGTNWAVVPSPRRAVFSQLYGVAARSPKDVWSVGQGDSQTLVVHWNGMEWVEVPSPNIGQYDTLRAVEVISRNDVWAVGESLLPDLTYLLMHWDGTAWSLVDAPPVSSSSLSSIKAFASNDVWAVGYKDFDYNANTASTFTMHWDGTAWSVIPSPNVDVGNYLSGMDGAAPDDLWAVGNSNSGRSVYQTLALHWNGTAWAVVPPALSPTNSQFLAVKVFSSNNLWAVGLGDGQALSERWNGTEWRVVPTPVEENGGFLFTVSGRDGAVWAAGRKGFRQTDELFLMRTR